MGEIVRKAVMGIESFVSIGKLQFDGPDMGAMNRLFTIIRVRLQVDTLLYPNDGPSIFVSPAINKMGVESATDESLQPMLDLSVLGGSISVVDSSVVLCVELDSTSLLPIQASLPFLNLRVGIDDVDGFSLSIKGLELKNGSNSLSNTIELTFGNDATLPEKLGRVVNSILTDSLVTNDIVIQGLRLGPSEADSYGISHVYQHSIGLFDKLNIRIPGFILAAIPDIINGPSKNETTRSILKLNLPPEFDSLDFSSLKPVINGLDIVTLPSSTLQLGLGAFLFNPLPFSLNISYVGVEAIVGNERIANVNLQNVIVRPGENNLKVLVGASIADSKSAIVIIQDITATLLEGGSLANLDLSIKKIVIGGIQALREIEVALPPLPASSSSKLDIAMLAPWIEDLSVEAVAPVLKSVNLETTREGLSFGAGAIFKNPAPVSLSVGHLSADIWLDGTRFIGGIVSNVYVQNSKHRQATSLGIELSFGCASDLKFKVGSSCDSKNYTGVKYDKKGNIWPTH